MLSFSQQQSTPNRPIPFFRENNKENINNTSEELVEKLVWDGSGNLDDLRRQIKLHKQVPPSQPILQQSDANINNSLSGDCNLSTPKKKIVIIKERKTPSKPTPSTALFISENSNSSVPKSRTEISKKNAISSTPNPHKKVTFAQQKPKEDDFQVDPNSLKNILQNRPVDSNSRKQRQTMNLPSSKSSNSNSSSSVQHPPSHPTFKSSAQPSTRFSVYTSNPSRSMIYPPTTQQQQQPQRLSIYQTHRPHTSSALLTDTPSKKEHLLQVQQKAAREFHALLRTPSKEFAKAMSQIGIPTNSNIPKQQDESFGMHDTWKTEEQNTNVSVMREADSREALLERPQNPLNKVFDSLEHTNKQLFGEDVEEDFPFYEPSDFVKQLLEIRENKSTLY